jgi:hypothetical protein
MSKHARVPRIALGVVILAGTCWAGVGHAPRAFTPYTPPALPQRAQGDFDGDGRPDVAVIQGGPNGSQVSIRLSGSSSSVYLSADVGSLIAEDIDGDGDLDLVAGAASGQVMAWLNDGHGRFTLQEPKHSDGISPETIFAETLQGEPAAIGANAPLVMPRTRNGTAVVVVLSRPPTGPLASGLDALSLSSPRAPPVSSSFS